VYYPAAKIQTMVFRKSYAEKLARNWVHAGLMVFLVAVSYLDALYKSGDLNSVTRVVYISPDPNYNSSLCKYSP